ncbi:iron complex transport system permease protein [Caldicellulosiruptor bescii]|uniref:Transport system permease protein n=2 Tax=Caldicellulosiruptor bescii TaxID=31899 RepID=B9MKX5_CALBD|nr:iron chelate uptake ABC transporter family permease subunit [Caldicellulosiruptor bescii]ACM60983.1 transport system permease protein [Caldicellulosiruptor bescii DSM 6725]PBC89204.1 iron complex transport system permease protein [Caldicellulosiruptor bescii]PBC91314.1 iron complex transport system permease protein [Caldicellulosiruptor bescii]PBD03274.1 iron complex transport system permease protein [Caldicellulosiruptor bescii]PBD07112.1 iron complex transport system permease protein [Cal
MKKVLIILAFLLFAVFIISIGVGSVFIPPLRVLKALLFMIGLNKGSVNSLDLTIVSQIRLPRILIAMVVGMSLSVAGALVQGLYRNPMADSGIIGTSSGASLGAIVCIAFSLNTINIFYLPLFAFAGALLISFLVYRLSTKNNKTPITNLILIGIAVSTFVSSINSLILSNINQYQVSEYIFWMLGSLDGRSWVHVKISLVPLCILILCSLLFAKRINILILGEEESFTIGVNPEKLKKTLLFLVSLITGIAVSVSGPISFVGLIVPHMLRLIVGSDYRRLIPASILSGGIFLIVCDTIARVLFSPVEVKVGIITSLVGVPYFLYLLKKHENEVSV